MVPPSEPRDNNLDTHRRYKVQTMAGLRPALFVKQLARHANNMANTFATRQ